MTCHWMTWRNIQWHEASRGLSATAELLDDTCMTLKLTERHWLFISHTQGNTANYTPSRPIPQVIFVITPWAFVLTWHRLVLLSVCPSVRPSQAGSCDGRTDRQKGEQTDSTACAKVAHWHSWARQCYKTNAIKQAEIKINKQLNRIYTFAENIITRMVFNNMFGHFLISKSLAGFP